MGWPRVLALAALLGLAWPGIVAAQTPSTPVADEPAVIDAGRIEYDAERDVIVADGGVTVVQAGRALSAERIEYFVAEDRIVAVGDVTLLEPTGEVARADRAEIADGLKRAVADGLGLRLQDGSRIVGRQVERRAGVATTLSDGAFTPCAACAEDPERAPLWRLRARKVEHDEVAKDINYEDVTLDIAGMPVAYLPYFSHPDPTVKRRTGFLAPTLFFGGEFEAVTQTPYYWSIGPDQDLTLKPYFTIRSAPVAAFEYRRLFANGRIGFDGSIGRLDRRNNNGVDEEDETRGHAFLSGEFALDETWRLAFDGKVTSDDSYLETFNIDEDDVLRSSAAVEGFWRESYVRVGAFAAQDLRDFADQNDTPFALPEVQAALVGAPTPWGHAFANFDARLLERETGTDGQSASGTVGWKLPVTTAGGHRFDLEASLRGDVYATQNGAALGAGGADTVARGVPRLVAGWRYPLVAGNGLGSFVLEPRVQAVLALDDARDRDVPNEDSRAVEFDESNFFQPDRFPGRDVIDDGQRVDYGLTATQHFAVGGQASAFVGQSLARKPGDFARAADMAGQSSDIVTALTATPAPWLDFAWRARLAKRDLDVRRSEIVIGAGPDWFRVTGAYVEVDGVDQGPEVSVPAHQANVGVALKLGDHWRVSASHHRDIADNDALLWAASIAYQDECISIDLGYVRDFVSQADGGGREDKVLLRINFKHLGGLGISQGVGGRDGDQN